MYPDHLVQRETGFALCSENVPLQSSWVELSKWDNFEDGHHESKYSHAAQGGATSGLELPNMITLTSGAQRLKRYLREDPRNPSDGTESEITSQSSGSLWSPHRNWHIGVQGQSSSALAAAENPGIRWLEYLWNKEDSELVWGPLWILSGPRALKSRMEQMPIRFWNCKQVWVKSLIFSIRGTALVAAGGGPSCIGKFNHRF